MRTRAWAVGILREGEGLWKEQLRGGNVAPASTGGLAGEACVRTRHAAQLSGRRPLPRDVLRVFPDWTH